MNYDRSVILPFKNNFKKTKKMLDGILIFMHITPVFSRGQSKAVFFGKFFFEQ